MVRNPLFSYTLPKDLSDSKDDGNRYDKPKGYTTVRYPLSGLVGTETDRELTTLYNNTFPEASRTDILNANVWSWLNPGAIIPEKNAPLGDTFSIGARLKMCMDIPNYTYFSNTTSASQYCNDYGQGKKHYIVPLESPHNAMHLAIGGFYQENVYSGDPETGLDANGDMGENNTAGIDPIFWFHHTFIDYTFWTWQRRWNKTARGSLEFEFGYPGTNTADVAGTVPSAGQASNVPLDQDSPLYPFKKSDGSFYTSLDVTNIKDLDYSYGTGSMDVFVPPKVGSKLDLQPLKLQNLLKVTGIGRTDYKGSFVVKTYARTAQGKRHQVGSEEILSRWNVQGCKNCQNHLGVTTFVPIHETVSHFLKGPKGDGNIEWEVEVDSHGPQPPERVVAHVHDVFKADEDAEATKSRYRFDRLEIGVKP